MDEADPLDGELIMDMLEENAKAGRPFKDFREAVKAEYAKRRTNSE